MELDHIFLMIDPDRPDEREMAAALGLREAYRRVHLGQGTRNVCYAFAGMFVEVLWVDDPVAVEGPMIRRTGLGARGRWRETGACPLGVAWRGPGFQGATWPFVPPYLPQGMGIAVAGDALDQPMLFQSPGTAAPVDWPAERQGGLQRHLGFTAAMAVDLIVPPGFVAGESLAEVMAATRLGLRHGNGWGLAMREGGREIAMVLRR